MSTNEALKQKLAIAAFGLLMGAGIYKLSKKYKKSRD
jgi:hypothetical protein